MIDLAPKKRLLLVEDSLALISLYEQALEPLDLELETAETLSDARNVVTEWKPDLVLLDLNLPDGAGIDLLKQTRSEQSLTPFIIITSNGSINSAVDAMREGAENFLVKPFLPTKLVETVKLALDRLDNETELLSGISTISSENDVDEFEKHKDSGSSVPFPNIIGKSASMQKMFRKIEIAGPTEANVLITGKTGTGKELFAKALHALSPRKTNPFVVINCAAIPKDLMESELFGHLKGSFTGATVTREGAAHKADGGTLFLDEIGEMDASLQTKLLRFIQNQTFQRVGSNKLEKVSVRFIAATNREPLVEMSVGGFREDLFYRLNVIPLHLPDLKDRGDDILLIADALVKKYTKNPGQSIQQFSNAACQKLLSYSWPGNVRQLENLIRNTLIFAPNFSIEAADIPDELMPENGFDRHPQIGQAFQANDEAHPEALQIAAFGSDSTMIGSDPTNQILKIEPLRIVEQKLIVMAMEKYDGNVAKVASALDISASSVYRKKSLSD